MILDAVYDTKTLDELQAEFVLLGNELSIIDNKRKTIHVLMEKRKAKILAQTKIANLSTTEKDALRKALEIKA